MTALDTGTAAANPVTSSTAVTGTPKEADAREQRGADLAEDIRTHSTRYLELDETCLRELRKQEFTAAQIAWLFSVSPDAVRSRIRRYQLPTRVPRSSPPGRPYRHKPGGRTVNVNLDSALAAATLAAADHWQTNLGDTIRRLARIGVKHLLTEDQRPDED